MKDPLASKRTTPLIISIIIAFLLGIAGIFLMDYSPQNFEKRSSLIKSISADNDLDTIFLYIDDFNTFIITVPRE